MPSMVYSRTNLGLFTMYGGSTRDVFLEIYFGDTVTEVLARLDAGEVIFDDAGTAWFKLLPTPGNTAHERIVSALRKYGPLSGKPLSMAARCGEQMVRRLAGTSAVFGAVSRRKNTNGTSYAIYGLYHTTPEDGERGVQRDHERY